MKTRALILGSMLVGPRERATLAAAPIRDNFKVTRLLIDVVKGSIDDVAVASFTLGGKEQLPSSPGHPVPARMFDPLSLATFGAWLLIDQTAAVDIVNNNIRESIEVRAYCIEVSR